MKKALLYLFLIGMLFLKSSNAFSLEETQKNTIGGFQNWNLTHFEPANNFPKTIKADYINDFENENDEYNSHYDSIDNKILVSPTSSCKKFSERVNYVFKIANEKTYFIENCSQITKYNYLSLRVLRL